MAQKNDREKDEGKGENFLFYYLCFYGFYFMCLGLVFRLLAVILVSDLFFIFIL